MAGYFAVAAIGALLGAAELVARYRSNTTAIFRTTGGWIYVLLNAAGSAAALLTIHAFGWDFGAKDDDARQAYEILVAGFGAAVLFRSSLFLVKIGDSEVGVGPSLVLSSMLSAADRMVDRTQGDQRAADVVRIMNGVSFDKARLALPATSFALMQNLTAEEQTAARQAVDALTATDMPETAKVLALGLQLMNLVGAAVLGAAVDALGESIKS